VDLERRRVPVGDREVAVLEAGHGPLALCLHGFPDTAWTWRHLLPALADAGFHAVAPFQRGYAPTGPAPDGRYQSGALAADAAALHDALGGDGDAVLVGHDWGAVAAYGAASAEPERWRRVVTAAVPPPVPGGSIFSSYDQLRRSWYMFFLQHPRAEAVVAADDMAFLGRLWDDWSPGYDATWDLARVREALTPEGCLAAAIAYYRASVGGAGRDPALDRWQAAVAATPPQPLLYLHGEADGCIGAERAHQADHLLAPGSQVEVLAGAGHFLHLERPDEVAALVVPFLSARS
jgi:pimeloyl-ACP methyl ester carboxylesterase